MVSLESERLLCQQKLPTKCHIGKIKRRHVSKVTRSQIGPARNRQIGVPLPLAPATSFALTTRRHFPFMNDVLKATWTTCSPGVLERLHVNLIVACVREWNGKTHARKPTYRKIGLLSRRLVLMKFRLAKFALQSVYRQVSLIGPR